MENTTGHNSFFISLCRAVDVENAIKLAAADDGFVTYEELREHLRRSLLSTYLKLY